jgi:hypothetical protein
MQSLLTTFSFRNTFNSTCWASPSPEHRQQLPLSDLLRILVHFYIPPFMLFQFTPFLWVISVSTGSKFVWQWQVKSSHSSETDHEWARWSCIRGGQSNDRYNDGTWFNATKLLLEFICNSHQNHSIWRKWLYELSKQLQDLRIDVTLHSKTHLKALERLYSVIYSAIWRISITCYMTKHIHKRQIHLLVREDVT